MSPIFRAMWIVTGYLLLFLSSGATAYAQSTQIDPPTGFAGAQVSSESIQWSWNPVLGSSTKLPATQYDLHDPSHNLISTISGPGTGSVTAVESGLSPGTYTRHVHA